MAFSIHDVWVPLTGGLLHSSMNDKCWIKIYPPPPIEKHLIAGGVNYKNCSSTVQNTVYGPGTPSGANWGVPQVSSERNFFRKGVWSEKVVSIFYYVVGERSKFFWLDSIG